MMGAMHDAGDDQGKIGGLHGVDGAGTLRAHPTRLGRRLFVVIFGHGTRPGKTFDLALFALIAASVAVVMLESIPEFRQRHGTALRATEWAFTGLFTLEYVLRLYCVRQRLRYATSFFGVVDLLAILPTYLSLLLPGAQALATVRALRLLRIFRVLKLVRFVGEAAALRDVVWQSRAKITVFLMVVAVVVTIVGAAMHVIEGRQPDSDFRSIPAGIYWAVVTMATVGYGDIVPTTAAGKFLSALLIVFGYALIVVPTGIVTAEWQGGSGQGGRADPPAGFVRCDGCGLDRHAADARYCMRCGKRLPDADAR